MGVVHIGEIQLKCPKCGSTSIATIASCPVYAMPDLSSLRYESDKAQHAFVCGVCMHPLRDRDLRKQGIRIPEGASTLHLLKIPIQKTQEVEDDQTTESGSVCQGVDNPPDPGHANP